MLLLFSHEISYMNLTLQNLEFLLKLYQTEQGGKGNKNVVIFQTCELRGPPTPTKKLATVTPGLHLFFTLQLPLFVRQLLAGLSQYSC